jgi:hypothetical protein
MTKKIKIFFSYSRSDSDFALKLGQDLRDKGVSVWIDQLDIKGGSRWDSSIETALNSATCVLVILSPTSVGSNNVMDEVSFALESGKSVIPVLLIDCITPFRLRRFQRIDFSKNYEKGLNQLLDVLILSTEGDENTNTHNIEAKLLEPKTDKQIEFKKQEKSFFKKEWRLYSKKLLFLGGIITFILLITWWTMTHNSSKDDLKTWNIALKQDDSTAYINYLKTFPNGLFKTLAHKKLDSINEFLHDLKDSLEKDTAAVKAPEKTNSDSPIEVWLKDMQKDFDNSIKIEGDSVTALNSISVTKEDEKSEPGGLFDESTQYYRKYKVENLTDMRMRVTLKFEYGFYTSCIGDIRHFVLTGYKILKTDIGPHAFNFYTFTKELKNKVNRTDCGGLAPDPSIKCYAIISK